MFVLAMERNDEETMQLAEAAYDSAKRMNKRLVWYKKHLPRALEMLGEKAHDPARVRS